MHALRRGDRWFSALALASFAFANFTLEWHAGEPVDGPPLRSFGVPLPWHAPGGNSLSWDIAPPALAFDFACFVLVSFAVVRAAERLGVEGMRARWLRVASSLLLVFALVEGALLGARFYIDPSFESGLYEHPSYPRRPYRWWLAPAFRQHLYE